jgi:hypothetical protein
LSKKDADQLVKDLRTLFAASGSDLTIEKRKDGHWHVVKPNGQSLIAFAGTPSDHRFRPNVIYRLRQRGIVPKDWR